MSIGQPQSRLDGPDKVTGSARYTADTPMDGVTHAVIVGATVPKGTIKAIDDRAAVAMPGVFRVFTYKNTPRFAKLDNPPAGVTVWPLQDDHISYEGQPVALVVADTLEDAIEAARLVRVDYTPSAFATDFLTRLDQAEARPMFFWQPDAAKGDATAVLALTNSKIEGVYATADRHHNPIELSTTLAVWRGGKLTVNDAVQGVVLVRAALAQALDLDPARVRVKNEYVGGGFGCKGWLWPHQLLAAMAARELKRPVKLMLTRAQAFTSHGYQPASQQSVGLADDGAGRLTAIRHNYVSAGSFAGEHVEPGAVGTLALYSSPAMETTHRLVRTDRGNPTPMRAPLEGVGLVAMEIAMDELAYERGIDPVELRLINYAEKDPFDDKPFSSKKLRECYEEGARRFGWAQRSPALGAMRAGRERVGYGMATALMQAFRFPAKVRLVINRAGHVRIETSTQEIGTGVRTIFPQIAADFLAIPIERVSLVLGDTNLPEGPMTAGSNSTLSLGSAIKDAAEKLKARLGEIGGYERLDTEELSVDSEWSPDQETGHAFYSFGAVFAEVKVDEQIPIPRVTRVVGVYSAGNIINPKTATSQMTGGIIWGIGQALLENSAMDHRLGRFLSKNLSGYLLPVNADVPDIDASFVQEFDPFVGPIGARGIGELGATGIGPAIANAVFHATGTRVRSLPIRVETLMEA